MARTAPARSARGPPRTQRLEARRPLRAVREDQEGGGVDETRAGEPATRSTSPSRQRPHRPSRVVPAAGPPRRRRSSRPRCATCSYWLVRRPRRRRARPRPGSGRHLSRGRRQRQEQLRRRTVDLSDRALTTGRAARPGRGRSGRGPATARVRLPRASRGAGPAGDHAAAEQHRTEQHRTEHAGSRAVCAPSGTLAAPRGAATRPSRRRAPLSPVARVVWTGSGSSVTSGLRGVPRSPAAAAPPANPAGGSPGPDGVEHAPTVLLLHEQPAHSGRPSTSTSGGSAAPSASSQRRSPSSAAGPATAGARPGRRPAGRRTLGQDRRRAQHHRPRARHLEAPSHRGEQLGQRDVETGGTQAAQQAAGRTARQHDDPGRADRGARAHGVNARVRAPERRRPQPAVVPDGTGDREVVVEPGRAASATTTTGPSPARRSTSRPIDRHGSPNSAPP